MPNNNDTSSISFTAHYTGYVWYHYGLAARAFATARGRLFFLLLRPLEWLARLIVGSDIKTTLLQRHTLIDRELDALIAAHPDLQILEIACGLSPRGHRFTQRHPGIAYVEADLPGMVARKRPLLESLESLSNRHRLTVCNILEQATSDSLEAVIAREFDPQRPLFVVTEGLVNYFRLDAITTVWQRLAEALAPFPQAGYITDVYPQVQGHRFAGVIRASNRSLKVASRSQFTLHFDNDDAARRHFAAIGFARVTVLDPDQEAIAPQAVGGALVRVIKAELDS